MKIAFFDYEEKDKEYLSERLKEHELYFESSPLTDDFISSLQDTEIISVRSSSKVSKELLSQLPKLQFLATRTTGVDHIDLNFCKEKGITVSNTPGYGKFTVAEHTIALLLCISRKLYQSVQKTKNGEFSGSGLMGFELNGRKLGVIGVGSIGRAVIHLAKAFGMHVIAYTKDEDKDDAQLLGYRHVSYDTLLRESDVISIHVPATPETLHLINRENIKIMKKGIVLINTARGAVVETEALIEGLQSGIFCGVGLDVLENEAAPTDKEKELMAMENVIVTPHNAYNSYEALRRILSITVKNITSYCNGTPQNMV